MCSSDSTVTLRSSTCGTSTWRRPNASSWRVSDGGAVGGALDAPQQPAPRRPVEPIGAQRLGVAADHLQQVVEVVGDAAGQPAERADLLRAAELLGQVGVGAQRLLDQLAPARRRARSPGPARRSGDRPEADVDGDLAAVAAPPGGRQPRGLALSVVARRRECRRRWAATSQQRLAAAQRRRRCPNRRREGRSWPARSGRRRRPAATPSSSASNSSRQVGDGAPPVLSATDSLVGRRQRQAQPVVRGDSSAGLRGIDPVEVPAAGRRAGRMLGVERAMPTVGAASRAGGQHHDRRAPRAGVRAKPTADLEGVERRRRVAEDHGVGRVHDERRQGGAGVGEPISTP